MCLERDKTCGLLVPEISGGISGDGGAIGVTVVLGGDIYGGNIGGNIGGVDNINGGNIGV